MACRQRQQLASLGVSEEGRERVSEREKGESEGEGDEGLERGSEGESKRRGRR